MAFYAATMTDKRVETFVNILIKASEKHRKNIPKSLLGHTKHCLNILARKQISLQTALDVWVRSVWPVLVKGIRRGKQLESSSIRRQQASSTDEKESQLIVRKADIPKVLEHVFTQLCLLHDGLILLVSGECRHEGDIGARKPFPTRLTRNATRADGYTQLYKATSIYSGASNDEWFDEHNGLQKEWRGCLGNKLWDHLFDKHPILEGLLTDIETKMQQLQQEFSSVSTRMINDLRRLFPETPVQLSLGDHMERLSVDPWSWERRGKSFQWKHPLGVLPDGWTAQQWSESLSWQPPRVGRRDAAASKKRRRVIDDDDDDEEDYGENQKLAGAPAKVKKKVHKDRNNQTLAEGLTVKTKTVETKKQSADDSLNAIKTQLGVNAQVLQKAREGLEAEENAAADEANAVDQAGTGDVDEDANEQQKRAASSQRVAALSKHLEKTQNRCSTTAGMYDVWDARECLRQALMEAGNLHLWSDSTIEDRVQLVRRADGYFAQASEMVKAQKDLHGRMVLDMATTEEMQMCWRNLLLLQSQALVNRGIAQIELGQRKNLSDAIQHLEECEKECRLLHKTATADRGKGASALETSMDALSAKQTETLSMRWKAEALWKLAKKTDAISVFVQAGNAHEYIGGDQTLKNTDLEVAQASLSACSESYYSWIQLIDLLALDKQRSPKTAQWTWIQNQLSIAFVGAVKCSRALWRESLRAGKRLQSFVSERDVMDEETLRDSERQLLENLQKRRESFSIGVLNSETAQQVSRSDLASSDTVSTNVPSRWLLTGDVDSRQRRKRKRYGAGYSHIRVPDLSEEATTPVPPRQRFRRWGDDMFPRKKGDDGNLVPDLPFPFCAPEMPDAIRSLLKQKGVTRNQSSK